LKAYNLWESRGKAHGGDRTDWHAAEVIHKLAMTSCRAASPPYFSYVQVSELESGLDSSIISYMKEAFFNNPLNYWVEISLDIGTVFKYDRNRRLHFDEGFLSACHRVFKDEAIQSIADVDHFPYRDLSKFRANVEALERLYDNGTRLPSPLFFYSAPYQLEILDGVHRCLAAFELARRRKTATDGQFSSHQYRVRLGVNRLRTDPAMLIHQLWTEPPAKSALQSGREAVIVESTKPQQNVRSVDLVSRNPAVFTLS
jgi:hypothetical protein